MTKNVAGINEKNSNQKLSKNDTNEKLKKIACKLQMMRRNLQEMSKNWQKAVLMKF